MVSVAEMRAHYQNKADFCVSCPVVVRPTGSLCVVIGFDTAGWRLQAVSEGVSAPRLLFVLRYRNV